MRKGIILDANLLLLLVIGTLDGGRFINHSSRLNAYSKQDVKKLMQLIERFSPVYVTPYILTEVSNLIDLKREQYSRAFELAKVLMQGFEELPVTLKEDVRIPTFITHGITDASLVELAKQHFVVTNDKRLLPLLFNAAPNNIIPFAAVSQYIN